jgi:hypothetical protein
MSDPGGVAGAACPASDGLAAAAMVVEEYDTTHRRAVWGSDLRGNEV